MALGSGLGSQLGTAEESTYGTPVTVDRFHEILDESLERKNQTLTSNGIGGSSALRPRRGSRRVVSAHDGSGDVNMEVATTGFGRWFKYALWDGNPTVSQIGTSSAYTHNYELGDLSGSGSLPTSLTVQKGVPQVDGTVKPFTFHGCVVTAFSLGISVDQILTMGVSLDAEDVDTSTALETASYGTVKLFHFAQGDLKIDSVSVAQVLSANIDVNYNLKTDRFYLGSSGLKAQPKHQDWPDITGRLSADFVDLTTFHDLFTADTSAQLELIFTGDVIDAGNDESLTVTIDDVRFEGETPKVSGPDVIVQNIPLVGLWDGTNAGIKIDYVTSDTAV